MKKVLKVLLVLILLGFLGVEVYYYFFKENMNVSKNQVVKTEKLETKYLADLYSGYTMNGIELKKGSDGKGYYELISGLKDKELQEKINSKIKNKVLDIKNNSDSKKTLVSGTASNFENSISLIYCLADHDEFSEDYTCDQYSAIDSLNIDLTTGKDVTINDVVNSKEYLKEELTKIGYESLMKSIGIVCHGGPCNNPDPDYSSVEEDLLSLITKYNKDDYTFFYTPDKLIIKFKDVNIRTPIDCEESEKGCKKYNDKNAGTIYINQDHISTEYDLNVSLIKILDHLTIYDKFKTSASIFEKEGEKVSIKFSVPNDYFSPQMIENVNELIDYDIILNSSFETMNKTTSENIKNGLFKEMKALQTKNFNIYDVFGNISTIGNENTYDYVYFDVSHYDMKKDIYNKNKKKIYTEKYNKISKDGGYTYTTYGNDEKEEYGYEFLKDYLDRKAFFYYIYDENGKEVSTEKVISFDYLESVIPDSWLKLGGYKSKNAMLKDSFIILNPEYKYPNTLVIYDYHGTIKLKYKNKEIKLADDDYDKYNEVVEELYK